MRELGVDPKIVADQQGHTLDVNLTEASLETASVRWKRSDRL
jgi:hypothetical protein